MLPTGESMRWISKSKNYLTKLLGAREREREVKVDRMKRTVRRMRSCRIFLIK
jgi:hypothetical protein